MLAAGRADDAGIQSSCCSAGASARGDRDVNESADSCDAEHRDFFHDENQDDFQVGGDEFSRSPPELIVDTLVGSGTSDELAHGGENNLGKHTGGGDEDQGMGLGQCMSRRLRPRRPVGRKPLSSVQDIASAHDGGKEDDAKAHRKRRRRESNEAAKRAM